jgi:hypothetical protein
MKSTKRFILSNSDLNAHAFRVLTAGLDTSDFDKNPVMLWMHNRADGSIEKMPVGFWDDRQLEGDNYTAVPDFDDNDPMAMKLYHKVEHGTIRAASAGIIPIELSEDPADMLPGQTLPSFKRSKIKEASLVDIGSNASAVTLYSNAGELVSLAAGGINHHFKTLLKQQHTGMKITTLNAPAVFALLKLDPEKATEADATAEIEKMITLVAGQAAEIATLASGMLDAENKVKKLEAKARQTEIVTLVERAIAARKITAGQRDDFILLAEGNFETTKKLLDGMKGAPTIQGSLKTGEDTGEVARLMKLSYDELFKSDGLERLKALDTESYKLKYKEKFGKEPAGSRQ